LITIGLWGAIAFVTYLPYLILNGFCYIPIVFLVSLVCFHLRFKFFPPELPKANNAIADPLSGLSGAIKEIEDFIDFVKQKYNKKQ
jgi:hypothetical protein